MRDLLPGASDRLLEGANQTPMFRLGLVEAVAGATLGQKAALLHVHDRDPVPHPHLDLPHLVAVTMKTVNAVVHPPIPFLRTDGTAGSRRDTVQITVIEKDPFPAVIHRAHVLPEETEEDNDPSHPAASLRPPRGEVGAREDTPQCRGPDLGLRFAPVVK